ncbi:MAG: hypothetical protein DRI26_00090 [Chloroflexi bacterium]|nr:MAG: hypothetical protein DRI26_00090 [Chloroflexota bacterium]
MLDKEEIKKLTKKGMEKAYLPVPSHGGLKTARFTLEDVQQCFKQPALLRDLVYLVGGVAVHGKGNDVDLVIRGDDLSEPQREALLFRLYRAFGDYFNIPYDMTPKHLHVTFNNYGPFTDHVLLYHLAIVPSEDRSIHEMEAMKSVSSNGEWIVYGYGSIDAIDLEGDEITIDALKGMWEEMQKTPKKYWNVMNEHGGVQVGEILPEWNGLKTHVDEKGFFVIVKLRKDIDAARRIWEAIHSDNEAERIKSFSIHIEYPGGVQNCTEKVCDKNRCWRKITKARFLELSFTRNPANPLCIFKPAF